MKLTTHMRKVFVDSALDDVPAIDYREDIRTLAQNYITSKLPPKLRAVWNDANLRGFLAANDYVEQVGYMFTGGVQLSEDIKSQIVALDAKRKEQTKARETLRQKLASVANGCNTRKQLMEALPEFEKYLPADAQAANRAVPAVANVVSDFVKAGWPKGTKTK